MHLYSHTVNEPQFLDFCCKIPYNRMKFSIHPQEIETNCISNAVPKCFLWWSEAEQCGFYTGQLLQLNE